MKTHPFIPLMRQLGQQQPHDRSVVELLQSVPAYHAQYLEYRLNGDSQQDFLFCINQQQSLQNVPLSQAVMSHLAILPELRELREQFPELPFIWLEHDGINQRPVSRPCWHACIKSDYLNSAPNHQADTSVQRVLAVIEHLAGGPLTERQQLSQLIDDIDRHGQLIHVSCMRARQPATVKFFVKIPAQTVADVINALNWPGDKTRLHHELKQSWFKPDAQGMISLDFNWIDGLQSQLGIVHSRMTLSNQDGIARISNLIEQDVIHGDDAISAVTGWLHPAANTGLTRWLDIKAVINDDQPISYKLYFGCQQLSLDTLMPQNCP